MSDNMNASTIPAKIRVVNYCAELEIKRQEDYIAKKVRKCAEDQIKFREEQNQKFFVKLFRKQKPVPTVDQRVEELIKEFEDNTLHWASSAYGALSRRECRWYERLQQLANLPVVGDNNTMQLSLEDAHLIEYNENALKV